jgi:hypothetical protein
MEWCPLPHHPSTTLPLRAGGDRRIFEQSPTGFQWFLAFLDRPNSKIEHELNFGG